MNLKLELFGSENEDTYLNVTAEIFKTLFKLMGHFRLFLPEGPNDFEYKKMLFHTSIDVQKLLEDKYGSFIIRAAVENLRKSIDFEPKFPFKAVRTKLFIWVLNLKDVHFQGNYSFINFSVSNRFVPVSVAVKARFMVSLRYTGKFQGNKKMVHICSFKTFGVV